MCGFAALTARHCRTADRTSDRRATCCLEAPGAPLQRPEAVNRPLAAFPAAAAAHSPHRVAARQRAIRERGYV